MISISIVEKESHSFCINLFRLLVLKLSEKCILFFYRLNVRIFYEEIESVFLRNCRFTLFLHLLSPGRGNNTMR